MVVSSSAYAEQDYYTWVDAQGRIHNTPIPESQSSSKPKENNSVSNADTTVEKPEEFLTEEQLDEKIKKEKKETPPFYTRVDADGRVYNEFVPQLDVEFASEEPVVTELLAVPFRLDDKYRNAGCCSQYLEPLTNSYDLGNAEYKFPIDDNSPLFATNTGAKPSLFLALKTPQDNTSSNPESEIGRESSLLDKSVDKRYLLEMSVFKVNRDVTMNIVALDKAYSTLYSFAALPAIYVDESWKSFAKSSWSLQLDDSEIAYLILNFNNINDLKQFDVVINKSVLK